MSESAMRDHYNSKQDTAHRDHRSADGKKPKYFPRGAPAGQEQPYSMTSDAALRQQLEFYLSDNALLKRCQWSGETNCKDFPVVREMGRGAGWVRLSFLATFPRLQACGPSVSRLAAALTSSTELELNEDQTAVRRKKPLPGMIGALARGELVLIQAKDWVHAVWKDTEGFLSTSSEKMQQAQQLGCIDPKDVDAWFESSGSSTLPGAINLSGDSTDDDEAPAASSAPATGCRWGAACPRLSTDPEHEGHSEAEKQLAEQKGVTAAVRALGGQWMTETIRQQRIDEQASRPDACPCWKGGASFCVMPSMHGRDYWQGAATVARLAQLEPGVDQSGLKAKREKRRQTEKARRDREAYLKNMTLQRFGGPPPTFAPCWPEGAFESLPDEILAQICKAESEWSGSLPGDDKYDVRRFAFVSSALRDRLRRARPEIVVRAYSGARTLQIDAGCWTVGKLKLEHAPVQRPGPHYFGDAEKAAAAVPRTLELLAQCRRLHTITMEYERSLQSVEFLANLPELRTASLHQLDGLLDASPLARCPKLETLSLSAGSHSPSRVKADSVLPILASPALTSLTLDCRCLSSVELPAPSASRLGFLCVRQLRGLTGDWSSCKELHTLILAHTKVNKIAPLAGCPQLRFLDLGGCPAVQDALRLSECPALRKLNVGTETTRQGHPQFYKPTMSAEDVIELSRECAQLRIFTDERPMKHRAPGPRLSQESSDEEDEDLVGHLA